MNGILVPPGTRGSTILDPASSGHQEADAEDGGTQAAQTDRWCSSS
jgi:hypothetical protein